MQVITCIRLDAPSAVRGLFRVPIPRKLDVFPMNADPAARPRFLGLSPAAATVLLIAVATVFRLFYAAWLPILPDEAYYFQWSRHLDASYFSKGPAVAYTIWTGTAIFGANTFGVRFFAVMLSAGTAWQIFLLARRWFDDVTGLISVLVINVIPLYALGAVVMTIDPLSAFFWVWAANLFSRALDEDRMRDWALTGFAVGCGFLAKYLNALELLAFLVFLLASPARRSRLAKRHFWVMLAVALACMTPVFWWNWQHHWVSAAQLGTRGHLQGPFTISPSLFLNFLGLQALVISPGIFLALIVTAVVVIAGLFRRQDGRSRDGEVLLFILFLSVFLLYLVLAWHLREEPNWPAISYLTLIVLLSAQWRRLLAFRHPAVAWIALAFVLGWIETLLLQDPEILHLPQKSDPMGRVVGWSEIAAHVEQLRQSQHADVLIADAYKEAAVLSFHLPDKAFIYAVRNSPPANQYDFWPGSPTAPPHRALWIQGDHSSPQALARDFNSITYLQTVVVSFKGKPFRIYKIFLCRNNPLPDPAPR